MIGLGLSLTRAALPMWTPRTLFAAGEQGAWYDPSDLSSLFQDAAGTTPVTATGQPVGLMKDKSGRGNHASQATTTARPLLQQDSGGRYYLAFDGVDDRLTMTRAASPVTANEMFAAVSVTATTVPQSIFGDRLSNTGYIFQATNAVGVATIDVGNGSSRAVASSGSGLISANVPYVGGGRYTGSSIISSVNAADGVEKPVVAAAGTANAGIGSYDPSAASQSFGGRLYGFAHVVKSLDAATRANLRRFLATRAGVTL